ncbi:MAG: hypothetical protein QM767_20420, partial [Anaeromyxobacter sp.]
MRVQQRAADLREVHLARGDQREDHHHRQPGQPHHAAAQRAHVGGEDQGAQPIERAGGGVGGVGHRRHATPEPVMTRQVVMR